MRVNQQLGRTKSLDKNAKACQRQRFYILWQETGRTHWEIAASQRIECPKLEILQAPEHGKSIKQKQHPCGNNFILAKRINETEKTSKKDLHEKSNRVNVESFVSLD